MQMRRVNRLHKKKGNLDFQGKQKLKKKEKKRCTLGGSIAEYHWRPSKATARNEFEGNVWDENLFNFEFSDGII